MTVGQKRLFLLDMDGTLYVDERLFDKVPEFLARVRESGGRYLFLTNNSSRGVEGYIEKLERLGIATGPEGYLTSVDAAIDLLRREYPGQKCYAAGTKSFRQQLESAGIPVTTRVEEDVDILLSGFDRELTFQKLEDACILLERGAVWLATNPDWVCPTWYGSVPDCGSVCEMLTRATGRRPEFLGKPRPAMVQLALAETGFPPEQAVLIGDRLYTDIACAVNAGIDSIFVLSGEGKREDIERDSIHPTWVYDDIGAVLRAWEETP